ncbi:cytochrome P450 6a22 [Stomoxys calcitrans]|uniref:cytochrome P450 6a22 n=1 Tax=Stomoxys calcitrans TaxID=35570 RepID=UPI0027E349AE|nr:cytochrome P450 6a22 [Stomoxys calcitrans]
MVWILTFALLLSTTLVVIFLRYSQRQKFWKRQNVETIGVLEFIQKVKKDHLFLVVDKIYQELCAEDKPCKVVESLLNTTVILQDQNAIKEVLTSQFENFPDRGFYINHRDPLLVNLARFHYDIWKAMRLKLTPAFSPAKMKYIFPTMAEVGDHFVQVLQQQIFRGEDIVDMHDICKRFSMDVIGTVAFGIECNSLKNPQAEFKLQGEKALLQHFRTFWDQFAEKYSWLMHFINFKYHSQDSIRFFTHIVQETLTYREKENIKRNDFMDLLIECRNVEAENKNEKPHMSLEMMVGQVFIFFVGGYESTAAALSQALFELSRNTEIQDKARQEVMQVKSEHGDKITHDSLKSLKYIQQIVQETLRKYPIAPALMRYCRHTAILNTSTGPITLPKDTTVMIPVYSIHNNPDFYPNPQEFCPERFDEAEEAERPPHTFLTFGDGPRNCIAAGFGKMELLFGLATLLSKFRFSVSAKTPQEVEFKKNVRYIASVENGIYLKVEIL